MPKDKQKSVTVFTVPSTIARGGPVELSSVERDQFRAAVATPAFQKALQNALKGKPSVLYSGSKVAGEYSTLSNNNIIQVLRGWEMFELALFSQLDGRAQKPSGALTETFPDSGFMGGHVLDGDKAKKS